MKTINGIKMKEMLISASNNLYNHYPEVDALNVFPVPDGDTGINMNLTLQSGVKEIANRNDSDVFEIARSFSKGLLMGARGNSGVITSQIFRGFSNSMEGKTSLTALDLAEAFNSGREVAYKAVLKPVEGTILTVIRESSQVLLDKVEQNTSIEDAMEILLAEARESLERTPQLLPVLKEAGVVDSGGAGLILILEGLLSAIRGRLIEKSQATSMDSRAQKSVFESVGGDEDFGYCTEFILRLDPENVEKREFSEKRLLSFLSGRGNSIVMVRDEDIVKVHVHTLKPGEILNYAQHYGEFVTLKIENMSEQHNSLTDVSKETTTHQTSTLVNEPKFQTSKKKEKYAIIAVSSGPGIQEIFERNGIKEIVSGGQTMNPSTEDFIEAIKRCNAEHIFILPNNSNIILAASQACEVLADKFHAQVIPTKTIPQGITAAVVFNPLSTPEENFVEMKDSLKTVKSGQVTYAIRDVVQDGVNVIKDQFIGLDGKCIKVCCKDKVDAAYELLKGMIDDVSELITVLVGSDVTDTESDKLKERLENEYEDIEFDFFKGDQPVYSFIVGIE